MDMRTILILAATMALGISSAEAACTCVCDNGKPQARCPSVLENPPVCPASTCLGNAALPAPAMPGSGNCKLEKAINPDTGRIEMRRVCK